MIKNYIKVFEDGSQVATKYAPSFGGNYNGFGDYYDIKTKKWYSDVSVGTDNCSYLSNGRLLSYSYTNGSNTVSLTNDSSSGDGYIIINIFNQVTAGKRYRLVLKASDGYVSAAPSSYINRINTASGQVYTTNTGSLDYQYIDFVADSTTSMQLYSNLPNTELTYTFAIIPLNDDGSIDISNGTPYTSQPTYLPYTVDVDSQGNVLNVDKFDMPTLVEEYVKADIVEGEHKGKNSCTAWVNFTDGTSPAIHEDFKVDYVIRVSTGIYDIHFTEDMDNVNYGGVSCDGDTGQFNIVVVYNKTVNSCRVRFLTYNGNSGSANNAFIVFFGGKA